VTDRPDLVRHESALLQWATYQLPGWVCGKLDPADLVQQTLLEAMAVDKLVGKPDHEVLAYLRRALAHNLIDAARKFAPTKADLVSAESSIRLADWLAADHTSPSERADRNERFARLAVALAELPDAQRVAVQMRYLQGMKVTEIAKALDRSVGAVSLLLHRAVSTLKLELNEPAI
jgi:RNA polymerase sigma-70 factor (ECF subfamily)